MIGIFLELIAAETTIGSYEAVDVTIGSYEAVDVRFN